MIGPNAAEIVAIQLAAISRSVRLRLLFRLATGPQHVTRLAEMVGAAATNVCQHLRQMQRAGLIECERQKYRVVYRVRPEILTPGGEGVLATLSLGPYRLQLLVDSEDTSIRRAATSETRSREDCVKTTRDPVKVSDRPMSFGRRARRKRAARVTH